MVVDDEEAILFAFQKILQKSNIEIDTARSLEEVTRLLDKNTYAAVISDLRLTGVDDLDGLLVVRETRKRQPKTRVILITAYGGHEIQDLAHTAGADLYMEKPVSPTGIIETLNSLGIPVEV